MAATRDESFIASTYYESMRDNFEGYAWEIDPANPNSNAINQQKADQLQRLKDEFEELDPEKGYKPKLGQLFKIELALVWLVPETALRARFWTIEDRFRRVVPTSVARSYRQTLASQPPGVVPEPVLRQRARNLLDTIHANYLINLAREQLIRRLMLILSCEAFLILAASTLLISFLPVVAGQALVIVIVAGMLGAMISIIQRLQKATSRDAMIDDGIFELIGLRIGWVSVIMSVLIGGVFALFIYVLVAADLLDQLLPKMDDPTVQRLSDEEQRRGAGTLDCNPTGKNACPHIADKMFQALGLASRFDLFKLVAYAFVSGFAERFVPDIITKLTKDVLPGARFNGGANDGEGGTGGDGGGNVGGGGSDDSGGIGPGADSNLTGSPDSANADTIDTKGNPASTSGDPADQKPI